MKNKSKLIFSLLFLAVSVFCSANSDFLKKINLRFNKQWAVSQQEKAYLHTDKPYYSAGENVWFKGYLVNATTHLSKSLSRFMYVELIDKSNKVLSRVKIKRDSLGFAGHLKLQPELRAGNYVLRAYTSWMQNVGTDFFFTKNIYVGNPIDDNIKSSISYGPNVNGKVEATITFTNTIDVPISAVKVEVCRNWNNPKEAKEIFSPDKDGKIKVQLAIDTAYKSARFLDVAITDPSSKYQNRFYLPEFSSDYDAKFMPESGNFLAGQMQVVAFKVIGTDGLGVEVEGKVYSNNNEEVAEFSSLHKGMGKFSLQVDSGASYYVVLKSKAGVEKRYNLPPVKNEGVALQLVSNRGKLWYQVSNRTSLTNDAFYLLAHCRGRLLTGVHLEEMSGQIPESALPSGIVSLSVVDTLGNVYCERLYFARNASPSAINMLSDKTVYGKRMPVDLTFNILSAAGMPCVGNYSLSVTDSKIVKNDNLADNIVSNLLLTSDLKGYIEDPGSYFTDSLALNRERLDVLMLTQGWSRFSTARVVKGIYPKNEYFMEAGQALSGRVVTVTNKAPKNCRVKLESPVLISVVNVDSLGAYMINRDFPDSTEFTLSAIKKNAIPDVKVIPDEDVFPKSEVFIPLKEPKDLTIPNDYFQQSKEKYYSEGGVRVMNLVAVTVTGSRKSGEKGKSFYTGTADVSISSEKLEEFSGMPFLDYLATINGIEVSGDQVSIRGNRGNPLITVNEVEIFSMQDVMYLTTAEIERLDVFKGSNAAFLGSRGGNGAICITLKSNIDIAKNSRSSIAKIKPLGYQKPEEFYMPKYDVDSERQSKKNDLRTTIYWNPELVTDSTGTVHVKFYTADKANDYSVVLEGITDKGEACRYTGIVKRK